MTAPSRNLLVDSRRSKIAVKHRGQIAQVSYRPNDIPKWERNARIIGAVVLIAWGTFGVAQNNLLWLGSFDSNIHLRGVSAWLMFGAMICAAAHLLVAVLDHYDRRNNEDVYQIRKKRFYALGWGLFFCSIAAIVLFPQTTRPNIARNGLIVSDHGATAIVHIAVIRFAFTDSVC